MKPPSTGLKAKIYMNNHVHRALLENTYICIEVYIIVIYIHVEEVNIYICIEVYIIAIYIHVEEVNIYICIEVYIIAIYIHVEVVNIYISV